jgi:hypothetical protein
MALLFLVQTAVPNFVPRRGGLKNGDGGVKSLKYDPDKPPRTVFMHNAISK